MVFHAHDRDEVELTGNGVSLGDSWDVRESWAKPRDRRPLRLDEDDRRDHDKILSPSQEEVDSTNICSYNGLAMGKGVSASTGQLESLNFVEGAQMVPELERLIAAQMAYGNREKAGRSREQIAYDMIQERHLMDMQEIEFAKDAALLAQSDLWQEWGSTSPVHWIRHYCKTSSSVAGDRVNVGEQMQNLPKSVEAVTNGTIGFGHLSVIARTAEVLTTSPTAQPFDETPLLEAAQSSSVGRLWYHCLHVRHRADADGVANEQRENAEMRYLQLNDGEDGWLFVKGAFDAIGAAAIRTAIEPLAQHSGDDDGRCRERRQADAFVELATHAMDAGLLPQHASQRPHLQVTTTLETLQGLIGAPAGEMALSLPISAKTVQRIACDSSITRVLLGADSAVIDAGRAKRVVSGGTRRLLDARDRHCRWPGCERPASWSSAHHVVHWAQGGKTDLSNMILLCQHHHWMVHEGGWRLSLAADDRVLTIPPDTEFVPSPRAPDEFDAA